MRILFETTKRPKTIAKSLKRELADIGVQRSLSHCQNLVARMFGYDSWNTLHSVTTAAPTPTSYDDLIEPSEVVARLRQYAAVLASDGIALDDANKVLEAISPSGRNHDLGLAAGGISTRLPTDHDCDLMLARLAENIARFGTDHSFSFDNGWAGVRFTWSAPESAARLTIESWDFSIALSADGRQMRFDTDFNYQNKKSERANWLQKLIAEHRTLGVKHWTSRCGDSLSHVFDLLDEPRHLTPTAPTNLAMTRQNVMTVLSRLNRRAFRLIYERDHASTTDYELLATCTQSRNLAIIDFLDQHPMLADIIVDHRKVVENRTYDPERLARYSASTACELMVAHGPRSGMVQAVLQAVEQLGETPDEAMAGHAGCIIDRFRGFHLPSRRYLWMIDIARLAIFASRGIDAFPTTAKQYHAMLNVCYDLADLTARKGISHDMLFAGFKGDWCDFEAKLFRAVHGKLPKPGTNDLKLGLFEFKNDYEFFEILAAAAGYASTTERPSDCAEGPLRELLLDAFGNLMWENRPLIETLALHSSILRKHSNLVRSNGLDDNDSDDDGYFIPERLIGSAISLYDPMLPPEWRGLDTKELYQMVGLDFDLIVDALNNGDDLDSPDLVRQPCQA